MFGISYRVRLEWHQEWVKIRGEIGPLGNMVVRETLSGKAHTGQQLSCIGIILNPTTMVVE